MAAARHGQAHHDCARAAAQGAFPAVVMRRGQRGLRETEGGGGRERDIYSCMIF